MFNFTSKANKENQLKMQAEKVAEYESEGNPPNFMGGGQFFQSMRDIGYADEGQAICDIFDNAVEAGASNIEIFTLRGKQEKIEALAIVDNGSGMTKEWLRTSISFGGTSRSENKKGLGRFGMGLSSAGIAFSEFLQVFSRSESKDYYKTWIDLRPESPGFFSTDYLRDELKYRPPEPVQSELPEWIKERLKNSKNSKAFEGSGTVIVLSDFTPSRRKWTFKDFEKDLADHMGVVFHETSGEINTNIDDRKLELIDPLFVTEGMKGFDLDEERALFLGTEDYDVHDPETGEYKSTISARYSVMPPTFGVKAELKNIAGIKAQGPNQNSRARIMRDWTGVILKRNGRIIGSDRLRPVRFNNNDYNIGIELSFSGDLDDDFGMTTLKNKVSFSDEAKKMLQRMGIVRSINSARKKRTELFNAWKASDTKKKIGSNVISVAEKAASIQKSKARIPEPQEVVEKIAEKSKVNTTNLINKQVQETGFEKEVVEKKLLEQFTKTDVSFDTAKLGKDGSFFEFQELLATKLKIIINEDHPFYMSLFATDNVSSFGRESLKLMLSSLYQAIIRTRIAGSEGGEPLHDSMTARHLIKYWSETFSEAMIEVEKLADNKGLSGESEDKEVNSQEAKYSSNDDAAA